MKYYIVSDVHGFCSILKKSLQKKGFFDDKGPKKLVVGGDLFDRGKEAVELQNFILELMERDEVILIKGNHEKLLLDMLNFWHRESYLQVHHHSNGTVDTVLQLTNSKLSDLYNNPSEVYHKMKATPFMQKILPSMVDYFEGKSFICIHGWIPCYTLGEGRHVEKFFYNEDWRNASKEEWDMCRWYNGMEAARQGVIESNKTIVCGHWHTSYGHAKIEGKGSEFGKDADFSPYKAKGVLAIDACTVVSKKINLVVIKED